MDIQDLTGRVSTADIAALRNVSTPLDVKVLFTSSDTRIGLEMHVHDMVTSANTLAIGVDPVHHYSFTHFGTGTGIRHGDYIAIERAGNGEFHAGNWGAGVRAIVNAASAASSQSQRSEVVIRQPVTVVEHHAAVWPYLLGFGLLAAACLLAWRWMRRRSISIENAAQEARDEAQEMRSRNIEAKGWDDKFREKIGSPVTGAAAAAIQAQPVAQIRSIPPSFSVADVDRQMARDLRAPGYVRPVSQPQYVQPMVPPVIMGSVYGGGNNDLLTGVLLAEALERPQREVVREVVREPVYVAPRQESSSWGGGSSDSGGGGSSWDCGVSSSSDSGGGGGFDSGGGSDGGGGGGDF